MWAVHERSGGKTVERRMCASCRFFRHSSSISVGRCGHPEHQFKGVTPLLRAGELRCRRNFEYDDWTPAIAGNGERSVDILVNERPAPVREIWPEIPFVAPTEHDQQVSRD